MTAASTPANWSSTQRSEHADGQAVDINPIENSFGWGWGGNWTGTQDCMHVSANGH